MANIRKTIRPERLTTTIPENYRARLDLYLYSESEGRIPKGAYQRWIVERIREFFETHNYDLANLIPNTQHGVYIVRGPPAALEALAAFHRSTIGSTHD